MWFRPLRRHPSPERAQQLSLHTEGIRLLYGGKVVPILFLSSLCDPNSYCNALNKDIIFYVIGFIY